MEDISDFIEKLGIKIYKKNIKYIYNIYISYHRIEYPIFLDLCLNDLRFGTYLSMNESKSVSKELSGFYKNIVRNMEYKIKFINNPNSLNFASESKDNLRIIIYDIIHQDIEDVVHDILSLIDIYNSEYENYLYYYKGPVYQNKNIQKINPFLMKNYSKKAADPPIFIENAFNIKPSRFALVKAYDINNNLLDKKYIAYCNNKHKPFIRWINNDIKKDSNYPYILVCRQTPIPKSSDDKKSSKKTLIKQNRFVNEYQLGILPEIILIFLELFNKTKNFYRFGLMPTIVDKKNPIPVKSTIDKKLGVTEPNTGIIIMYEWSLIACILYAENPYKYMKSNKEEYIPEHIDKIKKLSNIECNMSLYILEKLYNLRIIIITRIGETYSIKASDIFVKKTTDYRTIFLYNHDGGVWTEGLNMYELIVYGDNIYYFQDNDILNSILEYYHYKTVDYNIILQKATYKNNKGLYFKDFYCFTELNEIDIPEKNEYVTNNKENLLKFLNKYDIDYYESKKNEIVCNIDNILYIFPMYTISSSYNLHKQRKNDALNLRNECYSKYNKNEPLPILSEKQKNWIDQQIEINLAKYRNTKNPKKLDLIENTYKTIEYNILKNTLLFNENKLYSYICYKFQLFYYNNIIFVYDENNCRSKELTKNMLLINNYGVIKTHIILSLKEDEYTIVNMNTNLSIVYYRLTKRIFQ
jgi:hypothetical protein